LIHINHVAMAVPDLFGGCSTFTEQTGLATFEAGWYPSWGAGLRMAPLGKSNFLELASVVDPRAAERSPVAKQVVEATGYGPFLIGWCARVDTLAELEEIATRLDSEIFNSGVARNPDDSYDRVPLMNVNGGEADGLLRSPDTAWCWQSGLPNFFYMGDGEHYGDRSAPHRVQPNGISWLEVGGEEAKMREWLGPDGDDLPLRFNGGEPGLHAVGIASSDGEIVVRPKG
jgi:hypothetical protein